MIENYQKYLDFLDEKLAKFFNSQQPFIQCRKGCSKCCKMAQFPTSRIEMVYLLTGFLNTADEKTQDIVSQNIQNILRLRDVATDKKEFRYNCPFLINDICSVYPYRGIICRTFGLMTQGCDGKISVPFCCFEGMNYSSVIDSGTHMLSPEKIKTRGFEEEPLGFNVSYEYLTDKDFEETFKFQFGEKKPMIEWFINPPVTDGKK